ncbi:transposase [Microbacterium sp. CBA3102]|nr:transposase [Microbacterium sp. CBA3102]
MVEVIAYRYRTGIAWRDLPEVFGPRQTVWKWHRRMAADGTWDHRLGRVGRLHHRSRSSTQTVTIDELVQLGREAAAGAAEA